jgi:hypothetical protein
MLTIDPHTLHAVMLVSGKNREDSIARLRTICLLIRESAFLSAGHDLLIATLDNRARYLGVRTRKWVQQTMSYLRSYKHLHDSRSTAAAMNADSPLTDEGAALARDSAITRH